MATQEHKTVAFVLYPGLTLLDLVGPLQVFASLRRFGDQYRAVVVAERLEPMPTESQGSSPSWGVAGRGEAAAIAHRLGLNQR